MQFADNAGQISLRILGLRCPNTESMGIVVCVDEQRMSKSDFTDALAHQDHRCSNMAKGLFPTLRIKLMPLQGYARYMIWLNY